MLRAELPNRRIESEWLDELSADDPRAIRSRRDLRLLNRIMGHVGIVRRALTEHLGSQTPRIVELGAGDGTLLLRVVANTQWASGAEIVLLDRQPAVSPETAKRFLELGCRLAVKVCDVFEWLRRNGERYDALLANLFLHHFEGPQLTHLFELAAARTRLVVACEPRRERLALAGSRMVSLIGCNDVTRHDAVLSVHAGFGGKELSALWPAHPSWTCEERPAGLFSHLFVARKNG